MTAILLAFLSVVAPTSPETQLQIVTTPTGEKGALLITVTDSKKNSLADVGIVLLERSGKFVATGKTDKDGMVSVKGLDPILHGLIRATKEGYGPVLRHIEWQPVDLRVRLGKGEDLAPTKSFTRSTAACEPMIRVQRQVLTCVAETRCDPCTGGYYEARQPYTVYRPVWSTVEVWERIVPQTRPYYSAPCIPW